MGSGKRTSAGQLIQDGLRLYGVGQLDAALGAWRLALELEPNNDEAKKLVAFGEGRLSGENVGGLPPIGPEAATVASTSERGKARRTLVSDIPGMLSQGTKQNAGRKPSAIPPPPTAQADFSD